MLWLWLSLLSVFLSAFLNLIMQKQLARAFVYVGVVLLSKL